MAAHKLNMTDEEKKIHQKKLHNERMKRYYKAHKEQQDKVIQRNNERYRNNPEVRQQHIEYMKAYRKRKREEQLAPQPEPLIEEELSGNAEPLEKKLDCPANVA